MRTSGRVVRLAALCVAVMFSVGVPVPHPAAATPSGVVRCTVAARASGTAISWAANVDGFDDALIQQRPYGGWLTMRSVDRPFGMLVVGSMLLKAPDLVMRVAARVDGAIVATGDCEREDTSRFTCQVGRDDSNRYTVSWPALLDIVSELPDGPEVLASRVTYVVSAQSGDGEPFWWRGRVVGPALTFTETPSGVGARNYRVAARLDGRIIATTSCGERPEVPSTCRSRPLGAAGLVALPFGSSASSSGERIYYTRRDANSNQILFSRDLISGAEAPVPLGEAPTPALPFAQHFIGVDSLGRVYFWFLSDSRLGATRTVDLRVYEPATGTSRVILRRPAGIDYPPRATMGPDGSVSFAHVGDSGYVVTVVQPGGTVTTNPVDAGFWSDALAAATPSGTIVYLDTTGRLRELAPGAGTTTVRSDAPAGLTTIVRIASGAKFLYVIGLDADGRTFLSRLEYATGAWVQHRIEPLAAVVAVDRQDRLYHSTPLGGELGVWRYDPVTGLDQRIGTGEVTNLVLGADGDMYAVINAYSAIRPATVRSSVFRIDGRSENPVATLLGTIGRIQLFGPAAAAGSIFGESDFDDGFVLGPCET